MAGTEYQDAGGVGALLEGVRSFYRLLLFVYCLTKTYSRVSIHSGRTVNLNFVTLA